MFFSDEDRREERLETMRRRRRPEEPALIDEWRKQAARARTEIDEAEIASRLDEGGNDTVVLFRLARAGRIYKASTGAYHLRGAGEEIELVAGQRREIVLAATPADVRVTPYRTESRTGRVDKDCVESRGERQRTVSGHPHDGHTSHAGCLHGVVKQREAARP